MRKCRGLGRSCFGLLAASAATWTTMTAVTTVVATATAWFTTAATAWAATFMAAATARLTAAASTTTTLLSFLGRHTFGFTFEAFDWCDHNSGHFKKTLHKRRSFLAVTATLLFSCRRFTSFLDAVAVRALGTVFLAVVLVSSFLGTFYSVCFFFARTRAFLFTFAA